ncbi:MAG TPA: hypothetical protein VGX28_03695 [Frankiaceae bacterium]|nr:hypothetical protein [Frankiaceae bacterium]
MRRLAALALVAAGAAATAAPAHAYCVGTTQIGTLCASVDTGPKPSVELVPQDDCVYVVVGKCVPVTYYVPGDVDLGGPARVYLTCTGVFDVSGLAC